MTIIDNELKNSKSELHNLITITVPKYSFKLIDLELSGRIAKTLRNAKKELSGLSAPNLYDIPVVLRLIYKGLKSYNLDCNKTQTVVLETGQIIKNLYGVDNGSDTVSRIHLRHIFLLINEFLTEDNKPILNFKLRRNSPCILTIYPAFIVFAKAFLNNCSQYSVRLFSYAQKKLDLLRKKERAYALFLEKLYFQGKLSLQGAALSSKTLNKESSFYSCKTRIKDMFNNPKSKHFFSFSTFINKAEQMLKTLHYNDLFFYELADRTIKETNKFGESQLSQYMRASIKTEDPQSDLLSESQLQPQEEGSLEIESDVIKQYEEVPINAVEQNSNNCEYAPISIQLTAVCPPPPANSFILKSNQKRA